jgi:hypothetical protein
MAVLSAVFVANLPVVNGSPGNPNFHIKVLLRRLEPDTLLLK